MNKKKDIVLSLLIDNYDSYTFNLFQILCEINKCPPIVIRNDQLAKEDLSSYLNYFDNIFLSPGPGTPKNEKDFGVCSFVLESFKGPIFGVCLGMQGMIFHSNSGDVIRSPVPAHGQLSNVHHLETNQPTGLLFGIPTPFQAVRYHSLMVSVSTTSPYRVIATTEDNVVMAIEHKDKLHYGVQFHPEKNTQKIWRTKKIDNELIKLCLYRKRIHQTTFQLRKESSLRLGSLSNKTLNSISVIKLKNPKISSIEKMFLNFFYEKENSFWFDSSTKSQRDFHIWAVPVKPKGCLLFPLLRVSQSIIRFSLKYFVDSRTVLIDKKIENLKEGNTFFQFVNNQIQKLKPQRISYETINTTNEENCNCYQKSCVLCFPFDFHCGFVGYFGYEMEKESLEYFRNSPEFLPIKENIKFSNSFPSSFLMFCDQIIVFDHQKDDIYILEWMNCSEITENANENWLHEIYQMILHPSSRTIPIVSSITEPTFETTQSLSEYKDNINSCLDFINKGESYELCLTLQVKTRLPLNPILTYLESRKINNVSYSSFIKFNSKQVVVCSSPEKFLSIDRMGKVESKPIKGTRKRGKTSLEDLKLKNDLLTNKKDFSENLMIVDLVRNDLNMVCVPQSVSVPRLMNVESYSTVHQLVSTIQGELLDNVSSLDCIQACFPPGSMTGAPKYRSVQILKNIENHPRGIYSGCLGYLSTNQTIQMAVVIRTIIIDGDILSIGTGGAIVSLSDAEEEVNELLVKLKSPLLSIYRSLGLLCYENLTPTDVSVVWKDHHIKLLINKD